ncbi:MAG: peptide MFS transporter [Alphaproteobacteria bacterium]|nr:peptide MFS transporter [Alphaproteobacteria bacterium]
MVVSATASDAPPYDVNDRAFLGHPKGLAYLAFTEAWERFSFYGMQALLVLYMINLLFLPGHIENIVFFNSFRHLFGNVSGQALASEIFGTYTALVYLTPILGGFIADRMLGKRRTVILGAVTMALGHFLMAFESSFLFALLALVIGSGLLKGNISSQVSALYKPGDLRRADAFQIFYLGINAGVILAPLVVGTLGEKVGWHWGFGAAGVGMLVGLVIYLSGQKYLPREHFKPRLRKDPTKKSKKFTAQERLALVSLLILIPVLAVAIIPNNQIFNAYLVWANDRFDLVFFGTRLPTTWLITLDSVVSVSFLAIVALFYRWYGKHWKEPDELTKIIIGSVFSFLGMMCLFIAAMTPAGDKIGLFWPVMFHVINSIAFAHILPVSLALFARLAPKAINATVIGLYFLAFFFGNMMVGWIGSFYETMSTTNFWLLHAGFAVGTGIVFILFKITVFKRLAPT